MTKSEIYLSKTCSCRRLQARNAAMQVISSSIGFERSMKELTIVTGSLTNPTTSLIQYPSAIVLEKND